MNHAPIFSASILDRLAACPGSAVLSANAPRTSSVYADWGTDCHSLSERCLRYGKSPREFIGMQMPLGHMVDEEMADCARVYVEYVRDLAGDDGTVMIEQRVEFGQYLELPTEHQAFGTADALMVKGSEVIVVDLKTGRGVDVDPNCAQLKAYALGCLDIAEMLAEIDRVRLVVVQPRNGGIKEYDLSADELRDWARHCAAPAAKRVLTAIAQYSGASEAWHQQHLTPGEKQCQFCPAKATCPALRAEIDATLTLDTPADVGEFETIVQPNSETPEQILARALSKVDLIEGWCTAIRAEAQRRLKDGEPVPGFKIVEGKRGNRAWANPADVEALLKSMRLKEAEMYDFKLISPATAEKLHKAGTIGPRQWPKLQELITQPAGKPNVVPESDSRPALEIKPVADDFDLVA